MPRLPATSIPWLPTGNHWLAIPCIHPADGAIHCLGIVHRGRRGIVELAGDRDFLRGTGMPLARLRITVDDAVIDLERESVAWERALGWLPTFTVAAQDLLIRGTIFAPLGRDADIPGAVYAIAIENRASSPRRVEVRFEGTVGHQQLRVRSSRRVGGAFHTVADGTLVVAESEDGGSPAVAFAADGAATATADENRFAITSAIAIEPRASAELAHYIAVSPEPDGARATCAALARRGWRSLLTATRDALLTLEQSTGSDTVDRLINRNLIFAYFYAVGRALDDGQFYPLGSRAPWHPDGGTVRVWNALMWTLPAVQLADPPLARELLIRAFELYGAAPGHGVRYLDGALFQPGFSLDEAAAYPVALDRYIRDTSDDEIVEDPVVADTLYLAAEEIARRRDAQVPLYLTELGPAGDAPSLPFTLHANAVVAQAFEILRRTLDEQAAAELEDPAAIRAALRRHFTVDHGGKAHFVAAVDLAGGRAADDVAAGSPLWLPLYEAVERDDSTYRRSARAAGVAASPRLSDHCARLMGPDAAAALDWLRRASLDNGTAAEMIDAEGHATGGAGAASLSGLLAYSIWYAVHALGVRV